METAGQEGCLEEAALLSSLESQASRYLLGRKAHQAEGTAKARAEGPEGPGGRRRRAGHGVWLRFWAHRGPEWEGGPGKERGPDLGRPSAQEFGQ